MICIGGNYSEEHIEIWIQLESLPLHVVLRRHIKEHGQSTLIQSNIQSLHYMEYLSLEKNLKAEPGIEPESNCSVGKGLTEPNGSTHVGM